CRIASQLSSLLALEGPALVTVTRVRRGRRLRLCHPDRVLAELDRAPARPGPLLSPPAQSAGEGLPATELEGEFAALLAPQVDAARPRPLRGRQALIDSLCAHRSAGGGIAVVLGEAGTGKS